MDLIEAAGIGEIEAVKEALEKGTYINSKYYNRSTALISIKAWVWSNS